MVGVLLWAGGCCETLLFVQGIWEGGQENLGNTKHNVDKALRIFSWSAVGHVWTKLSSWWRGADPAQGGGQSPVPVEWSEGPPAQQGWFQSLCASPQLKPSDTELISPPGRAVLLILKCLNVMGKVSARRLVRH